MKILFIDDDLLLGQIITAALAEEGYEVCYQNSLAAVLAVADEVKPDIVVLDVEIGGADGIDAIPQVHRVLPGVPVIIVSSHTEASEVVRAMDGGAVAYLKKPFEPEELSAYVRRYTAASSGAGRRLAVGTLTVNRDTRMLSQGDRELKRLTKLELALLELFVSRRGQVVSREDLEKVWEGSVMNEHSLYNYIKRLRELLAADPSLRLDKSGAGYVFTS